MGCVESRPDQTDDSHPTIFQVENIEGMGPRHRYGSLEVTDSYLVYHCKKRTPVEWPLICLRRYGYETESFAFESGRKCPTGPGTYRYRSSRAEMLFNVVQLKIRRISRNNLTANTTNLDLNGFLNVNDDYLNPIPPVYLPYQASQVGSGAGSDEQEGNLQLNSPVIPADAHLVTSDNGTSRFYNRENSNGVRRSSSIPSPPDICHCMTMNNDTTNPYCMMCSHSSELMYPLSPNTTIGLDQQHTCNGTSTSTNSTSVPTPVYLEESQTDENHIYMNVGVQIRGDLEKDNKPANSKRKMTSSKTPIEGAASSCSHYNGHREAGQPQPEHTINYIYVDIDKAGSDSSHQPPFSPAGSVNSGQTTSPPFRPPVTPGSAKYTIIDFQRTEALSNIKRTNPSNGSRNNSTFSTNSRSSGFYS